jgi:hypothetical protein
MLAVGWLESKLPEETDAYRDVMRVAHRVIAEAFSNAVIVPGVTTNEDVAWWMRQRVAELGLGQWHSIELNVKYPVKEWGGQPVQFALEEDAALLPGGWDWIAPRQTTFYLIR